MEMKAVGLNVVTVQDRMHSDAAEGRLVHLANLWITYNKAVKAQTSIYFWSFAGCKHIKNIFTYATVSGLFQCFLSIQSSFIGNTHFSLHFGS